MRQNVREYGFEGFNYDCVNRELTVSGLKIVLPFQEATILCAFLEQPNETLSRVFLSELLWPEGDNFDFERSINNIVSKIRRTLGEQGRDLLQTIPKGGYRLRASVEVRRRMSRFETVPASAPQMQATPPQEASVREIADVLPVPPTFQNAVSGKPQRLHGAWFYLFIVGCSILLAVVTSFFIIHRSHSAARIPEQSIGLLPFNTDAPEALQISKGLRLDIADAVSQIPQLQVRAENSVNLDMSRNDSTLKSAAETLHLDYLVTGDFTLHGDIFDLRMEVIRGKDSAHLFSYDYNGNKDTLVTVPNRFQKDLFQSLQFSSTSIQTSNGSTESPEAYGYYLKAGDTLTERSLPSLQKAIDMYTDALRIDPHFARAYAGMAEAYLVRANYGVGDGTVFDFEQAKKYAREAIAQNGLVAQAHSVLGLVLLQHDWDIQSAASELGLAVSLNPGSAANHLRLAVLLTDQNKTGEAHEQIALAHRIDPLWPVVYGTDIYASIAARQYSRAIEDGNSLVRARPDWSRAHQHLGWAYWYAGRHDEAVIEWKRAASLDNDLFRIHLEDVAERELHARGVVAYAQTKISIIESSSPKDRGSLSDYVPSEWYAFSGDRSKTIDALTHMVAQHDPESLKIATNPAYDFMHGDAKFQALLHKTGLTRQ